MLTHNPTLTLVNGCHINIMMPFWCGKPSSEESKKKMNKESFNKSSCTIPRKFKNASEDNGSCKFGGSRKHCRDAVSGKGFALSKSGSPFARVSHCQSIPEWPRAQPLPLPGLHQHTDFGINVSPKSEFHSGSKPLLISFLHERVLTRQTQPAGDLAAASASSHSSTDSDNPPDSWLLSDNESRNRTAINSPSSLSCCTKHKDQSPVIARSSSKERQKPTNLFFDNDVRAVSADHEPLSAKVKNLQIPAHAGFCTAPDGSTSSPSRIPLKLFGNGQVIGPASWTRRQCPEMTLFESGHCPSPGSGQNSGHNSVAADMSGYLFWPQSRCYPDCSPIPSPRMTSPGPSSRAQSGAVTPLRPQAEGVVTELPIKRTDVGKHQQSHRLPLPPVITSNSCPFPPLHPTATTLSVPRTPGRAESPVSPFSRWKKGRLLGRGSFGHVYLGFNSETGEMCAMKEVTLFWDDAKSKENAQQLGQEIALLSRLQHPNIVQYYGAETFDDKLCIYLEYVSGGSIHKLLQEYGQLGESAIRNYSRQILSGLAYLHAKNTIHRDIKGANILVDPSGRVKLADFGMAKHIAGQYATLSFKGSPYWMAPEVIRNSSCCSLAVDIWGLGCTILEMATAKPPWSQYEGVPALYKIGNNKELPAIPEHLSEEAKNFIRQCLQWNPQHRPTAMQLLEHPFVKIASPVERPVLSSDPPQPTPLLYNAASSMEMGHLKSFSRLDSEGADIPLSSGSKITSAPRDAYMPRNISCPVSSISSPLLHPKSPQRKSEQISPIYNLRGGAPGSSPPHTVGSGNTPWTVLQQPATSLYEGIGIQRCRKNLYASVSPHKEWKHRFFHGIPQMSLPYKEIVSLINRQPKEQHDGRLVLADRVSSALEGSY